MLSGAKFQTRKVIVQPLVNSVTRQALQIVQQAILAKVPEALGVVFFAPTQSVQRVRLNNHGFVLPNQSVKALAKNGAKTQVMVLFGALTLVLSAARTSHTIVWTRQHVMVLAQSGVVIIVH